MKKHESKHLSRILAAFLVVFMLVCMLPAPMNAAYAEEPEPDPIEPEQVSITITPAAGLVYGSESPVAAVTTVPEAAVCSYQVTAKDETPSSKPGAWKTVIPTAAEVGDAGDYTLYVKASAEGYTDAEQTSADFTIGKASVAITFENAEAELSEEGFALSATVEPAEAGSVEYSLVSGPEGASIEDGKLMAKDVGEYQVNASVEGSTNYEAASADATITLIQTTDQAGVNYILNVKNTEILSAQEGVSYTLEDSVSGIIVNEAGAVVVNSFAALADEMTSEGLSFTVKAKTGDYTYDSIPVTVSFAGETVSFKDFDKDTWYNSDVTLSAEGFLLSDDLIKAAETYVAAAPDDTEVKVELPLYAVNVESGDKNGNVSAVKVAINFDTKAPVVDKDGSTAPVGKDNKTVTVTIPVSDISGVSKVEYELKYNYSYSYIDWGSFKRVTVVEEKTEQQPETGVSISLKDGILSFTHKASNKIQDKELTYLEVTVYDGAGNQTNVVLIGTSSEEAPPAAEDSDFTSVDITVNGKAISDNIYTGSPANAAITVEGAEPTEKNFVLSVAAQQLAVTWADASEKDGDGNVTLVKYTATPTLATEPGIYDVSYSYFVDHVEKTGTFKLIVDGTAPDVSRIKINDVSVVADAGVIQTPDGLKVSFDVSDPYIESCSVEVDGNTYTFKDELKGEDEGDEDEAKPLSLSHTFTGLEDGSYTVKITCADNAGNTTTKSITVVVDNTKPVITLTPGKEEDDTPNLAITVEDANLNEDGLAVVVKATDINGKTLFEETNVTETNVWTVSFDKDGIYSVTVNAADKAGNEADQAAYSLRVDTTAPSNVAAVTTGGRVIDTILEGITFGFYKAPVVLELSAEDFTSGVDSFRWEYVSDGASATNVDKAEGTVAAEVVKEDKTIVSYKATVELPKTAGDQYRGTLTIWAKDADGNESEGITFFRDGKEIQRIVIDTIAPNMTVTYNAPKNIVDGVSYFDGNINGTIHVTEANFFPELFNLKNGDNVVAINWQASTNDSHTGSFTLFNDGIYNLSLSGEDYSGHYVNYTSGTMVIDTKSEDPIVTINGEDGDQKSFSADVVIRVQVEDQNLDPNYKLKLSRVVVSEKDGKVDYKTEDVTAFLKTTLTATTLTAVSENLPVSKENDGIYTLTVEAQDKALHQMTKTITFTVNRFGSVFSYDEYLVDLISNGGGYRQAIDQDLVFNEFNANEKVSGYPKIEITRDGRPVSDVKLNEEAVPGGTWNQYRYTISKDNFAEDGIYKVSITSLDKDGNNPQKSDIVFYVDGTAPELPSVVGLEKAVVNASQHTVQYTVYDSIGISTVEIWVDGQLVDTVDTFTDPNNYTGSFVINEKDSKQAVRIRVTDLAGNVTDTDGEGFTSEYVMVKAITVSTNAFVRFYANKALFWGSIAAVVVVAGGVTFGVVAAKKKKKEPAESAE